MSRLPGLNAVLFLGVIGLGAFIYLRPAGNTPGEQVLSRLKPLEAKSISIERSGASKITLEKADGGWRITAPLTARGDDIRVQRLLEILEARASARMPANGLARFELEPPAVRMTIDTQAFDFGMVNSLTREQYVMTGGAVYTVNPRFGATLPVAPTDIASKQLFGPGEIPERIVLKEFTVEQRSGKWSLSPAPTGELSQDDYARWVDGWRFASAIRVEPFVGGKPRADIEIRLKNGTSVTLGMLASGAELVLTRPDEKLQYYVRIDAARRLLTPPGTRPAPTKK
jgi:hypothetical protein